MNEKCRQPVVIKMRDANMEWLRVCAMLMIIISHISSHGIIEFDEHGLNSVAQKIFTWGRLSEN